MGGPGLPTGKLPPLLLRRAVLSRLGRRRAETVIGARLGVDAAVLDLGGDLCVLTTDPITTAGTGAARLSVHVACNDLATMGAQPVGVLPTLLFPAGVHAQAIESCVGEIDAAANELDIEVLGGHTEVAPGLTEPLIVIAAVGRASRSRLISAAGAHPGDALLLTKATGLEGTSILALDFAAELVGRVPDDLLAAARGYRDEVSVVREGLEAAELGATAMHDPTEGGVLGAIWEMAEASGLGVVVEEAAIPVREPTRAICHALAVDPLRLISSGALLVACPEPDTMASGLARAGIEVATIGRFSRQDAREVVARDGSKRPLEPPDRDELYRLLERAPRR